MLIAARRRAIGLVAVGVLLVPTAASARTAACRLDGPAELVALAEEPCARVAAFWGSTGPVQLAWSPTLGPGVAAQTSGARVLVSAQVWPSLTPVGQRVVLAHELVHVATRSVTSARTPLWLVEGLADLVALRGSGISTERAAQELRAAVRAGRLPARLPTPGDFTALPAQAYEGAWLAVALLDRRYGDPALRRLYARAGSVGAEAALRQVDGTSTAALTRAWRAELRRLPV